MQSSNNRHGGVFDEEGQIIVGGFFHYDKSGLTVNRNQIPLGLIKEIDARPKYGVRVFVKDRFKDKYKPQTA